MIEIRGTVASAHANRVLAPCRKMPFHSCEEPIQNAGQSTKVTKGILNKSQNRTNLANLSEASQSNPPIKTFGWLATIPATMPLKRAKPTMIFLAKYL